MDPLMIKGRFISHAVVLDNSSGNAFKNGTEGNPRPQGPKNPEGKAMRWGSKGKTGSGLGWEQDENWMQYEKGLYTQGLQY